MLSLRVLTCFDVSIGPFWSSLRCLWRGFTAAEDEKWSQLRSKACVSGVGRWGLGLLDFIP